MVHETGTTPTVFFENVHSIHETTSWFYFHLVVQTSTLAWADASMMFSPSLRDEPGSSRLTWAAPGSGYMRC